MEEKLNWQVIIVGHSAGGISVTDAMYKITEKIKGVVYVAAPMLKHGFSTTQDIKDVFITLSLSLSLYLCVAVLYISNLIVILGRTIHMK